VRALELVFLKNSVVYRRSVRWTRVETVNYVEEFMYKSTRSEFFTSKDGLNCVKYVVLGGDDNLSVV
jgi:hypothetical protein